MTVIVLIFTLTDARRATIEANRAIVQIQGIGLLEKIDASAVGQQLKYALSMRNFGREPGYFFQVLHVEDGSLPRNFTFENTGPDFVDQCKDAIVGEKRGSVVNPNAQPIAKDDGTPISPFVGETSENPGYTVTQDLVDGREIFYARGCAVYRTLGDWHKTAFCHFLMRRGNEWGSVACKEGNYEE